MAELPRLALASSGQVFAWASLGWLAVLAVSVPGSLWLGGLAVSLVLVSLPAAWPLRRLVVRCCRSLECVEGESVRLEVELEQRSLLPLAEVELYARSRRMQGRGVVPILPAFARTRAVLHLRGLGRGRVEHLRLEIESRAPLGLLVHRRTLEVPVEALVLPRTAQVKARRVEEWLSAREPRAAVVSRSLGIEEEFHALREFRPGDREQRVHPRLSARRGRKVLTEWHGSPRGDVHVYLDARVPRRRDRDSVDLETSLRLLAGFLHRLHQSARRVHLHAVDEEGERPLVSVNRPRWESFLRALAEVEARRTETGVRTSLAFGSRPAGGLRVLLHHGAVDESTLPPDVELLRAEELLP